MTQNTRVELLLFLLARDHLPTGVINQVLLNIEDLQEEGIEYIGDAFYLGQWASVKADRLLSNEA